MEELKKKIFELSDAIDSLRWNFEEVEDTFNEVQNISNEITPQDGIKDIKNFKEKFTIRELNNFELENFIDEYVKFYNK